MPQPPLPLVISPLSRDGATPLHQQLYAALREAILAGRVARGMRVPATRTLADELGISRNTVVSAYDQLRAEGYLESRQGSGITVSRDLPELNAPARPRERRAPARPAPRPGRRGSEMASLWITMLPPGPTPAFRSGLPALEQFPVELWSRLSAEAWRTAGRTLLGYAPDPAGHPPLREAVAEYLRASRAVACTPEQVIIVSGAQQGLYLAGQVLLDPGEQAWVEEPGYRGARTALQAAGIAAVPVPLDGEGLRIDAGQALAPRARAVYVTPSHQYPTGVTMSLARRLELLRWAREQQAWIFEDDYDSEYRYDGRPLASLQGLDPDGRVLYAGTFSKVLCPALRLGYLVVPRALAPTFVHARTVMDRHSPTVDQAVLARFLAEGHFARHIRRTRELYRERQARLVAAARRELRDRIAIGPHPAGLHLVGWLQPGTDDGAIAARARELGVASAPLSAFYAGRPDRAGLVLGYAGCDGETIEEGVRGLQRALDAVTEGRGRRK